MREPEYQHKEVVYVMGLLFLCVHSIRPPVSSDEPPWAYNMRVRRTLTERNDKNNKKQIMLIISILTVTTDMISKTKAPKYSFNKVMNVIHHTHGLSFSPYALQKAYD